MGAATLESTSIPELRIRSDTEECRCWGGVLGWSDLFSSSLPPWLTTVLPFILLPAADAELLAREPDM